MNRLLYEADQGRQEKRTFKTAICISDRKTMVLKKDSKLKFPHLLLIDASAGSGKTHTLTQRFVQFLLSKIIENNDLTNMLAITFKNNAAQEMKRRILLWLKKLSIGKPCPELDQTKELLSMPADRICFAARHALA